MTLASLRRTLTLSVVEGSFTQVFLIWSTGSVLIGYMLYYNAPSYALALVSSVPMLAQMLSPLVVFWSRRLNRRRGLIAMLALLGRGLWLLAALAPQWNLNPTLMPWLLVLIITLSSLFQSPLGSLWTAWMGDIVPEDRRGRYFGFRTGVVGVVGMAANLAVGWYLDFAIKPFGFQIAIGLAVLSAVIGAVLIFFHAEPEVSAEQIDFHDVWREPWSHLNFRHFLVFAAVLHFGVFLGAPFVYPYFLQELQRSFSDLAWWSVIAAITALITTNIWGAMADRFGNRTVLEGCLVLMMFMPATWILAALWHPSIFWLSAVFDAIVWGGGGPALFNLALSSAPASRRVVYIAMYSATIGLAGFIGGLLASPLLIFFEGFSGSTWTAFHSLFVLSGVLRLSSIIFLVRVQESKSSDARLLLRYMRPWRQLGFWWRQ